MSSEPLTIHPANPSPNKNMKITLYGQGENSTEVVKHSSVMMPELCIRPVDTVWV